MHMIDKDAVLHMIDINIEPHTHGAWDSGYNVALSEIKEKIKQMPTVEVEPCTFCVYNPPSSCDGKPCTICPAHKRSTEPPKGE